MVGYVQEAVAKAIRNWPALKDANVIPVRSIDGDNVVVNTPLPAIAIHIRGTDGQGNTYLGGGIRLYFDLDLLYLCDVPNFTFAADSGLQARQLDLSDEIIRCIELSADLDEVKRIHDLNLQFDRMETDTTYGQRGSLTATIDVHKICYNGSVQFDPRKESDYARLEHINLNDKEQIP